MKKNHFLLAVIVIIIVSAVILRLRENSGQWICQDGQWLKQGRTTENRPNDPCPGSINEDLINDSATESLENLVGGDRDQYGCLPSAGYVWCPSLSQCLRPWEDDCPLEVIESEGETEDPLTIEPIADSPIRIAQPLAGEVLSSPYEVRGWAPGTWFFEANLPIKLVDATGQLVAITGAMTSEEWMTEDLVPFSGTLEFSGVSGRGELIIMKDNPSGLPEYDAEVRLPIRFSSN